MTKENCFQAIHPHLLTAENWDKVWNIATVCDLRKGDTFIHYGKVADSSAFVLNGAFKQSWTDDQGNEKNIDFYFQGDLISDWDSHKKNSATVYSFQSLQDSQLITFSNNSFYSLLDTDIQISRWGMQLSQQLTQRKLEHLQLLSISDPYERYKLLFNNRPEIIANVSNTEIAKYLFLARETISRARLKLLDESRNFCD